MKGKTFIWLAYWFWSQSNADWEHGHGINISTTKEGKWKFNISIEDTQLDNIDCEKLTTSSGYKISCCCDGYNFIATTDSVDMEKLFEIIHDVFEPHSHIDYIVNRLNVDDSIFLWLVTWYNQIANQQAKNKDKICIRTLDNPGWSLQIDLQGTGLENCEFSKVSSFRSENDWIVCRVENAIFNAACGPFNFTEVLNIFYDFTSVK